MVNFVDFLCFLGKIELKNLFCLDMSSPKIIGIGESVSRDPALAAAQSQLLVHSLGQTMAPRVILELMASLFEDSMPESVTITDALNALLAQQVLREKDCDPDSPDSPDLVLMVSSVVARFMRRALQESEAPPKVPPEAPFQDQILADLRGRLVQAPDSVSRFFSALQLGDRALHVASGWVGQRDFVRRTTALERFRYATDMAVLGYRTAFELSTRARSGTALAGPGTSLEFLFSPDRPPAQQIHRAVRALSGLRSDQKRVRELVEGKGSYTSDFGVN